MKYFKITCSNGYCGCDETFYYEVDDNTNLDNLASEILWNDYNFYEPDDRFLCYEDEEEYDYAYEEYQDNCEVWYEEVTKEEYEENK